MPGLTAGMNAGVEQLGLQEDLAVGDGDDVGGDIGRHVAGLGLDDGQRGQTEPPPYSGAQPGRTLQQTAVQIEDVAGVGFTSRRTADQQRQGTVGHSVLGQVVIDDEDVLALVA